MDGSNKAKPPLTRGYSIMVNQKQAVKNAVLAVFPEYELNGEVILADIMTDTAKASIKSALVEGFLSGKVEMSQEGQAKYFGNTSELSKYVTGLINNWVRKDPEFNNGGTYEAKNPGSRQGSGDRVLKALRQLLKTTDDNEAKAEIETAIQERLSELKPKVEIDVEAIPAHLRKLIK